MTAPKSTPPKTSRPLAGAVALLSGPYRRFVAAGILVVIAYLGISSAWQNFGGAVVRNPKLIANADTIVVPPQPDWVHTDVKADVIRDGSLESIAMLDPMATVKVSRAFELHTWVARVKRVYKQHPNRVVVDLEYRRPAAMVKVPTGLVPVDGLGIVLPPEDFQGRAKDYLRVHAGETIPAGPVGTSWGDEKVQGGAAIAAVLVNHWQKFDLYCVNVTDDNLVARKPAEITYELLTNSKVRITWGHAPGLERASEPNAYEKLSRLVAYFEKNGAFLPENNADYDLRDKSGLIQIPRTAKNRQPLRQ